MTPVPVIERLPAGGRIKEVLLNAARHPGDAYMFAGPLGAGKLAAARAFAAAVVCSDGCGECPCCSRALRGIHPDLSWFEPEGYTYPIEALREMAAAGAQSPMESSRRVLLVEQAGLMAERSQNALLKALEEPAPALTWVLVADSLDAFLPTILSRCTLVEFAPVPEEVLRSAVESAAPGAPDLNEIVKAARGDLDAALSLATDDLAREVRDAALSSVKEARPEPEWAVAAAASVMGLAARARARREKELQDAEAPARGTAGGGRRSGDRAKRILRRAELETISSFTGWFAAALRDRLSGDLAGRSPAEVRALLELLDEALAAQGALRENANPGLLLESLLLGAGILAAGRH